jgi:4-amino-4-deoxy-L-arabinose transferase-like glycosyltransferase
MGRGSQSDRLRQPVSSERSWWLWLTVWTVLGLGIRVASVLGRPHRVAGGDAYFYHNAANLLVAGHGYINPFLYYSGHGTVQTASFPPGFVFVLAVVASIGLKSFFAQRIWCCIVGAGAIVLCGLAGREIGGRKVGLMAAFLVAVYPNIWMSDELGLSETLSPVLVALVLLMAYRFWKRPGWWTAVWLGAAIGAAALTRDELSLLGAFIVVPLVLTARTLSWRRRVAVLAVATVAAVVVVGPWVGYNLSRFKNPVFISSGLGVTLASANCSAVYSGPFEGYWSYGCALRTPINPHVDESVQGAEAQTYALHFVRSHENRILPVEAARLGRAFGFFHPLQQIRLDSAVETRPYHWALAGLGAYYGLLAASVGGLVILRRRRIPIFPLLAVGLTVVFSVGVTFGTTRYRSPFEVSLVLMSAVLLDWIWTPVGDHGHVWSRRGHRVLRPPDRSGALPSTPEGTGEGEPSETALQAPTG